jgi:hypothetical protein
MTATRKVFNQTASVTSSEITKIATPMQRNLSTDVALDDFRNGDW